MTRAFKIISLTLAAVILLSLIIPLFLGVEGTSLLLGCDVETMSFPRFAKHYEFSLVERFPIIILVSFILIVFLVLIGLKNDRSIELIRSVFRFFKSYFKDTFYMIKDSKVKYLLLISFLFTTYLAWSFPLTLDEPQTYFDFIKPPFWEALAFYPYPNNHVLSSVLSNITNEIPGLDLLFRLRLPALIISILTWVFAYRFVKKFFSENLALFVVAIGSAVVTNLQHAYIARGYAFVMFFVVIGMYAAYNIIHNGNRRRDWLAFAVSSALGAWTMPSYLYPFLSISIFIFIYNYKLFKTQIFYSALVGILVFVLYSPILVFTGLESLTSNQFVETIDRVVVIRALPGFILGTIVHMFYAPHYLLIGFFALIILFVFVKKDRDTLILWGVFCITPCLFLILHSVVPFFRTFFYYGFIFVFMIAVTFKDEIKRINSNKLFVGLLVIHFALLGHFINVSRSLMKDVFLSYELREKILEDNKSYYLQDAISWIEIINMRFEGERKNYEIEVVGGNLNNADNLEEYDYCLIDAKDDRTTKYTPLFSAKGLFSIPVNVYEIEK